MWAAIVIFLLAPLWIPAAILITSWGIGGAMSEIFLECCERAVKAYKR